MDAYAFGVVLYELISAKAAVVKTNDSAVGSRGLVALVNFLSIPGLQLMRNSANKVYYREILSNLMF